MKGQHHRKERPANPTHRGEAPAPGATRIYTPGNQGKQAGRAGPAAPLQDSARHGSDPGEVTLVQHNTALEQEKVVCQIFLRFFFSKQANAGHPFKLKALRPPNNVRNQVRPEGHNL